MPTGSATSARADEARGAAPSDAAASRDAATKEELAAYCNLHALPVNVSTWDADELMGLTAADAAILGLSPTQSVRLVAKIRGVLDKRPG